MEPRDLLKFLLAALDVLSRVTGQVERLIALVPADRAALEAARRRLAESNDDLAATLAGAGSDPTASGPRGDLMAKRKASAAAAAANLQPVIDEMTRTVGVEQSAIVFIAGVPNLIQAAVDDAIAGGATAEQLQPLLDLKDAVAAKNDELLAALTANAPTA